MCFNLFLRVCHMRSVFTDSCSRSWLLFFTSAFRYAGFCIITGNKEDKPCGFLCSLMLHCCYSRDFQLLLLLLLRIKQPVILSTCTIIAPCLKVFPTVLCVLGTSAAAVGMLLVRYRVWMVSCSLILWTSLVLILNSVL